IAHHPASTQAIQDHLVSDLGIEQTEAATVARASHGLPGWAILAAADRKLLEEREQRVTDFATLLEGSRLERLRYADALAERWTGHNEQVLGALEAWIDTWRDLALAPSGVAVGD